MIQATKTESESLGSQRILYNKGQIEQLAQTFLANNKGFRATLEVVGYGKLFDFPMDLGGCSQIVYWLEKMQRSKDNSVEAMVETIFP